jgi:hypothetical protein
MRFARELFFAVLTVATCLPASAQRKAGTFTLPYETKWNNVTIPAGEYTISIYSESQQIAMLRPVSSRQSAVFLVPVSHDYNDDCASSTVHFAKKNGEWNATSACFADSGLTIYFAAPRSTMMASAASAAGAH